MKNMEKIFNKKIISKYLNNKSYRNYFSSEFDEYVYLIKYKQNERIINQGDEVTTLYFLIEGKCRVFAINKEGKVLVINTIVAPALIGEIELIGEDVSFFVETIEKSNLLALPYENCKEKLLKDNNFLYHLCESLIEKEREHALNLTQVTSFPLENRLAKFLNDNAYNNKITLKKTIIAESLGVSYRHLEKVMNDFVLEGILKKERLVYTIVNKKALLDKAAVLDIF